MKIKIVLPERAQPGLNGKIGQSVRRHAVEEVT